MKKADLLKSANSVAGAVVAAALMLVTLGAVADGDGRRFGAALSGAVAIRIADLRENPDRYVDRLVRIEGLVDDICPKKGCWVDIIERQSSETIRFKVEDDVIVFPAEARGREIVAEGILRRHALSKAQAIRHLRHLAEEKGEAFDESTVEGEMVFYQIEGHGAVVRDPV